eukprot:TRINITY_DN252_c0_g1_i1.p1 TRINITY_DN252_c0_g1~~TRINITY_DN252_c0_g1_i1.p1  ORF type:complete len:234 (-),score=25.78 TRINITY_DN252_c0_g1_i1:39-740(-)
MMSSFWRLLGYADEAGHIDGQEEQPQGWLSWLSSFVVATPPASLSQDGEDSDSEREDIESHGTTTPTQPRKRDSSPPPTAAPLVEVVKHVESPVDYKPVISTFSDLPKVQSARLETPQRNRSQRPAGTVRTVSRKHMREEWPSLSQEYVEPERITRAPGGMMITGGPPPSRSGPSGASRRGGMGGGGRGGGMMPMFDPTSVKLKRGPGIKKPAPPPSEPAQQDFRSMLKKRED